MFLINSSVSHIMYFILVPIFIACLTVCCLIIDRLPWRKNTFDSLSRNSPLDGLRGILSLSVLVHHFYITYFWKTTGIWARPESDLLNNFGAISVSLFFLITGYLFLNKIQKKEINWKSLYISRVRRIVPLYFFIVSIILVITMCTIKSPYTSGEVIHWIGRWILFKGSDLAGFNTGLIIAGVNWTLIYEWAFYFILPVLHSIFYRKIDGKLILLFSIILFTFMMLRTSESIYLLFVLSYPAIFYKKIFLKLLEKYNIIISIMLAFLFLYCLLFTEAYSFQQKIILSIIFCFIANGFTFFGILNVRGMKILGDISYSIYLIHGLILYISFTILNIFNFNNGLLSFYAYFPLIFFVVVVVSLATHTCIEKPFISERKAINSLKNS